jgi:DNA invertase Pin-like site-specific DNA recombinase
MEAHVNTASPYLTSPAGVEQLSSSPAECPSDSEGTSVQTEGVTRYAFSYERQSVDFPEGIEAQYRENARAAAAHGYIIPNSPDFRFSDDETSGTTTVRRGFDRMLKFAESGDARAERIYCRDKDRLGRWLDPRRHFYFEVRLEDAGTPILYGGQEAFDYKNDRSSAATGSFLMESVANIMARDERIKILERTNKGMRECVIKGFFPNKQPFYATERWLADVATGHMIEVVPRRGTIKREGCRYKIAWTSDGAVEVVKEIFQWLEDGHALYAIAQMLTERGTPAPSDAHGGSSGGKWHREVIREIARNPIYCGDFVLGRTSKKYDGMTPVPQHAADPKEFGKIIVTDFISDAPICREQWAAVQGRLDDNVRAHVTRASQPRRYPLSGLIICEGCGTPYCGFVSAAGVRYYRHNVSRARHATACGVGRYIRADSIEPVVARLVEESLDDEALGALVDEEISRLTSDAGHDSSERELVDLQRRLTRHVTALRKATSDRMMIGGDDESEDALGANAEQHDALSFAIDQHSRAASECRRKIKAITSERDRLNLMKSNSVRGRARVSELREAFEAGDARDQKRIIGVLLESIQFNGQTRQAEVRVRAA